MWKVFIRVVNSSIFGSSVLPDFGFGFLLSLLNCKARISTDSMATRDVAREIAERIMTMVNLDSFMTCTTNIFPSVVVSIVED